MLTTRLEERIAWPLVCAFVFTIPWEKSLTVPGIGTSTRLVGVLAFVAVAGVVVLRGSLRAPNLVLAAAAAFAAWEALTYVWSISRPDTAERALTFLQLAAMLWLIWETCRTARRQRVLMAAYVAGSALASALTLARYARGLQTYYRRYAAPGFDPNDLALTVALSIPLALYLSGRGRGCVRWCCRAAIGLAIAALLLAASRTSLIVSLMAFGFVPLTWRQSDWGQRIWSMALLGLLVAGVLQLAPSHSRERLATLPAEATRGTLHDRTQIWKAGFREFRAHPILGVGAGAFPEAVRPRLGTPARPGHRYVAHNSYLSILVESGAIGLGLFVLLLGGLVMYVWFLPWCERALWYVMLSAWAVGITTLTWEFRKPGWLLVGLIMTAWARAFAPSRESP